MEDLVRLGLSSGDADGALTYITPDRAAAADRRRRSLLRNVSGCGSVASKGTKPHLGLLSPGCQRCMAQRWSCLFLTNYCNADCFFCPGNMVAKDAPAFAERFIFHTAERYAAYVERLGFDGVSFSGGDPFQVFDKLIEYITAVRGRLGDSVYIWAYTNGTGVTPERAAAATAAGLDEIRFDIAATSYQLKHVRSAIGEVPTVTVEIPAIPEDRERVAALLPELRALGVDHLNLHQLMVLGDNAERLQRRGYSFTRTAVPAVVESELAALEIMRHATEAGIDLPINYCAHTYKERWHNTILEMRASRTIAREDEQVTETGLIRRLEETPGGGLEVSYFRAVLTADDSDGDTSALYFEHRDIALADGERMRVFLVPVSPPTALSPADHAELAAGHTPLSLAPWELVPHGMSSYQVAAP